MARRILVGLIVFVTEFAVLEAGLRIHGGSDASPAFQSLFMQDASIGHRLKPNARARYTTVEFSTDLAINGQGVRDDEEIQRKQPNERRVVVLGDSLVLSVQVPLAQTFCERLEARLNAKSEALRWRVINAGVQGYGPLHEWFFFDRVVAAFEPDLVLIVAFVGNDAIDAHDTASWLDAGGLPTAADAAPPRGRFREWLRSSIVLQLVRLRWEQLRARLTTPAPARALISYEKDLAPELANGLEVTRRTFGRIAGRARADGAETAIVLMPTRFQTDDADYGRLAEGVRRAGGELVRHAATDRFRGALAPLGLPILDLLPVLEREPARQDLFYQRNIHLTRRGHDVVGGALFEFLETSGLLAAAR